MGAAGGCGVANGAAPVVDDGGVIGGDICDGAGIGAVTLGPGALLAVSTSVFQLAIKTIATRTRTAIPASRPMCHRCAAASHHCVGQSWQSP
jgi:hypothetical protein